MLYIEQLCRDKSKRAKYWSLSLLLIFLIYSPILFGQTIIMADTYGMPGDPQSPADYSMHASCGDIPNGQNGWEVKALACNATSDTVYPNQASATDLYINFNLTVNRTGNLAVGDSATIEYSFDGGTTYYSEPIGDWSASNRIYFARTFYLNEVSVINIRVSLNTTVSQAKWWVTSGNLTLNQSPTADSTPTSLSFFTDSDEGSLPVELIGLKANTEGDFVKLSWATLSEENNDYFMIERSYNGVDFEEIGAVNGAGNSYEQQNYTFVDHTYGGGEVYYRLSQFDYNGKSEILKIIRYSGAIKHDLKVYPNPTSDYVFVESSNNIDRVELMSLGGSVLSSQIPKEFGPLRLNLAHLQVGVYLVCVYIDGVRFTEKIHITQ